MVFLGLLDGKYLLFNKYQKQKLLSGAEDLLATCDHLNQNDRLAVESAIASARQDRSDVFVGNVIIEYHAYSILNKYLNLYKCSKLNVNVEDSDDRASECQSIAELLMNIDFETILIELGMEDFTKSKGVKIPAIQKTLVKYLPRAKSLKKLDIRECTSDQTLFHAISGLDLAELSIGDLSGARGKSDARRNREMKMLLSYLKTNKTLKKLAVRNSMIGKDTWKSLAENTNLPLQVIVLFIVRLQFTRTVT